MRIEEVKNEVDAGNKVFCGTRHIIVKKREGDEYFLYNTAAGKTYSLYNKNGKLAVKESLFFMDGI